jgi:hypothetical protein
VGIARRFLGLAEGPAGPERARVHEAGLTYLTVLEELADVFAILEVLSAPGSLRGTGQPGDPDQARPERPFELP